MNRSMLKHPSAFLPLVMSLICLSLVLGHAAIYGVVEEADEGTAAHIFQLLMVAQLPIIGYFAIKWLPQSPKATLTILALQAAAGVVPFAALFLLT